MNALDISTVQILSVLGPALAFGFLLGWFLAVSHLGGSSNPSDHHDKEE